MPALPRRRFLSATAGLGAFLAVGPGSAFPAADDDSRSVNGTPSDRLALPAGWRTMKKLDAHNHVMQGVHKPDADWSAVERTVEAARVLGINKLYCSRPLTGGVLAPIEAVRDANESVLAAMKRYPGVIEGYCFVQPGNGMDALDEIDRCIDAGMIGIKLYNQFKYSDPAVFPIAEKCIDLKIPFLGHSAYLTDAKSKAAQPQTSNALDFGALATRYPELLLILGHINGGGDWEWTIRTLRDFPTVFLDTSGSVLEDDTIGLCVRELGHQRLLFATDQTMEGGVGKVLGADLTDAQREDIFWRNFQRILDRRAK
jgi:predicted TIM-barrel fold metal-dependent hydrolase